MNTVLTHRNEIPMTRACAALQLSRASTYRRLSPCQSNTQERRRGGHPRSLKPAEREAALSVLHGKRFIDQSPREIYSTLLDEGVYHCSVRTLYRLLEQHGESRERRAIVRHRQYTKPELLATGPNQVWSWDITKLPGPKKWTYFYLYVILDIFSRYVVGWMVAEQESGVLAKVLIAEACEREKIQENTLTIHSDRGKPMTSKSLAFLMSDLGITQSLNRPYVSNDNPFSEAQFKTLK